MPRLPAHLGSKPRATTPAAQRRPQPLLVGRSGLQPFTTFSDETAVRGKSVSRSTMIGRSTPWPVARHRGDYFRSDSKSIHPYYNVPEGAPFRKRRSSTPTTMPVSAACFRSGRLRQADRQGLAGRNRHEILSIENENSTVQTGTPIRCRITFHGVERRRLCLADGPRERQDRVCAATENRIQRPESAQQRERMPIVRPRLFPSFLLKYDASDTSASGSPTPSV